MKIIEGLKKSKDLLRKAEDIRTKIGVYCANLDFETPAYPDQAQQIKEWLQAHRDITQEILNLKIRVAKTNLTTQVKIEIGGNIIGKCITEWVYRRRDLAKMDLAAWLKLTDKNLREGKVGTSTGEAMDVKIRRYYEPKERDKMVEMFTSEPMLIDAALEVTNAVTELNE